MSKRIFTALVTAVLLVAGAPATAFASDDYRTVAHRGERIATTENSLMAINYAMNNGAVAVETDVRITKDGALVIMHDRSVTRTSRCTGYVDQMTLARITSYECRLDNGELIPTLDQFLARARTDGLNVDIEVKKDPSNRWGDTRFDQLRSVVSGNAMDASVRVSSFQAGYTQRAKAKGFYTHLIGVQDQDYTPAYVATVANAIRYPTAEITAQTVTAFHAANLEIFCRGTDNDSVRDKCKAAGVDDSWIDEANVPRLVSWRRSFV